MTKINVWKCDICQKEFNPRSQWSDTNMALDLYIPKPSEYLPELKQKFEDTCGNCREKIIDFILELTPNSA